VAFTTATSGISLIFKMRSLAARYSDTGDKTIEMVRSEVKPEADGRMKVRKSFQLEGAHFDRLAHQTVASARPLRKAVSQYFTGNGSHGAHFTSERAIPVVVVLPFVPVTAITGIPRAPTQFRARR